MRNTIFKVIFIVLIGSIFLLGCKKDEVRPAPTVSFYSGIGYIDRDTTAASGASLPIIINCKWNGVDVIKSITIYLNNEYPGSYAIPDSAKQEGTINIELFKSSLDLDTWLFEIADANGQKAYLGVTIKKDKTGGAIIEYKNISIGAQNNTGIGSFYAFSNSSLFSTSNALNNQAIIDLVLGYDADNKTYLASPSADLTGEFDLSAWTIKNTAIYCKTKKTTKQYGYVDSDILIISEFNQNLQSEKAKDLKVGDIYSVKLKNNKYGLIKINSITTGADGGANFDIKLQK